MIKDFDGLIFPSHQGESEWAVPLLESENTYEGARTEFPIPPQDLWLAYGKKPEDYLKSGRSHCEIMFRLLDQTGFAKENCKHAMDFGCAAARMLRHLPAIIGHEANLWGVDIRADFIAWCSQHLTPEMNFATTTIVPHLPFCERTFDLVFCGSVFSHIDDLAQAWLLELARVMKPGGRLYFTIHDENTVHRLKTRDKDHDLARKCSESSVYRESVDNFGMIVIGSRPTSLVFYSTEFLRRRIPPQFRMLNIVPNAYGYQSAVILERLRQR